VLRRLPAQTQPLDQLPVALGVSPLQISQVTSSLAHHFEQTLSRMLVVFVSFQVLSERTNAIRENSDLNLRRTGVVRRTCKFLDDFVFLSLG